MSYPTILTLPDKIDTSQRRNVGIDADAAAMILSLVRAPDIREGIKGQIETWNAQASAAVFVGAIQAQLLKPDISSRLDLATNILFLTGTILNVTGAYFALTGASYLKTDLNNVEAAVKSLNESEWKEGVFDDLTTLAKRFVKPDYNETGRSERPTHARYSYLPLEQYCRSIRRDQCVGELGSYAIRLGFIACPAALGCLACDYHQIAVRIAASAVIAILLLIRFVFFFIHLKKADFHMLMR